MLDHQEVSPCPQKHLLCMDFFARRMLLLIPSLVKAQISEYYCLTHDVAIPFLPPPQHSSEAFDCCSKLNHLTVKSIAPPNQSPAKITYSKHCTPFGWEGSVSGSSSLLPPLYRFTKQRRTNRLHPETSKKSRDNVKNWK